MLCESCGQNAQLNYTEVVGGEKQSRPLCTDCARQRGLYLDADFEPGAPPPPAPPSIQLTQVTATFTSVPLAAGPDLAPAAPRRCQGCGTNLVSLRKTGRVGCPECYDTFREHLEPLLRRVHGKVRHCDATTPEPRVESGEQRLRRARQLQRELTEAIHCEDFERAAHLRDEIRQLGHQRSGSEPSA